MEHKQFPLYQHLKFKSLLLLLYILQDKDFVHISTTYNNI